jgi:hypothetical protein
MTVIVNEFEVITDKSISPEQQQAALKGEAQTEQPKTLRPADILRIQEWQQQRLKRLFAD